MIIYKKFRKRIVIYKKKKLKMCGNHDGRRWYSAYTCGLLLFGGGRVRGPVKNMVQFILMNQYYYDSYP